MIIPRQRQEWGRAETILIHEPGMEVLLGLLEPHSANYARPFDLTGARWEHQNLRFLMEARGIQVITLRDALTQGCTDRDGEALAGENLTRLRAAAEAAWQYEFANSLDSQDRTGLEANKRRILASLHPSELADLIILRPRLRVSREADSASYHTLYQMNPLPNLHYVRDGLITTGEGVVVGRFALESRQGERDCLVLALEQLGMDPILMIEPPGTLEGGDFIPAGDFVFQGQGVRSNAHGVAQMLQRRAYGFCEVAVVHDEMQRSHELHLNTYFMMLGRHKAVLGVDRLGAGEPVVDLYYPEGTPENFRYVKQRQIGLLEFLHSRDVSVITLPQEAGVNVASSFLVLDIDELVVSHISDKCLESLVQADLQVQVLEMDEIIGGYGGLHCLTQVLNRSDSPSGPPR